MFILKTPKVYVVIMEKVSHLLKAKIIVIAGIHKQLFQRASHNRCKNMGQLLEFQLWNNKMTSDMIDTQP